MRKAAIALALVAVVAGGWTALWFYAAHEAARHFDAWLADEDAQGRTWTCPNRQLTGYPTALTVHCRNATFAGNALGQSVLGSVAAVKAQTSLLHPTIVKLTLAPPFHYRSSDGATDLRGQWTDLRIDLEGLPDIKAVALEGADINVAGTFGSAGRQSLGSARLTSRFVLPKGEPDPTIDFDIAVGGTDVPQIDSLVGDAQSTDLHFVGRLDRADIGDARTPEDAMDQWRRAGGRIDLASARISRGISRATASGVLRLDADHRPQGRLNAELIGLEPILKRYGINANLASAGALLGALFGGAKTAPSEPGAIALPISLQDGRLGVGPIRTQVELPPLY